MTYVRVREARRRHVHLRTQSTQRDLGHCSDAVAAQKWCESRQCPQSFMVADETNCCLHYVNIHFCPVNPAYPDAECRPWLPFYGAIQTHSIAQVGPVAKGNWTFSIALHEVRVRRTRVCGLVCCLYVC